MQPNTSLNLKRMTNAALTESFIEVSRRERKITAEVVEHVREFNARRLFLEHGCTSTFGYLTTKLGYSGATAQNRIDAARLLDVAPDLNADLANGSLNLTQVSVVAQGLRQLSKERSDIDFTPEQTKNLLKRIKDCDVKTSALIVAQELDLELKQIEKLRPQKDESVRIEMTLTKTQFEALRRAKDLASHVQHDASWADVVSILTTEYLKRKDPLAEKPARKISAKGITSDPNQTISKIEKPTSDSNKMSSDRRKSTSDPNKKPVRTYISILTKREVAKRDGDCRQIIGRDGETCCSKFQLQFDHIIPVYRGGGNEAENLQILCAVHNRLKFENKG